MREVRRPGDLLRYRDDSVVALFDDMGYRTLRLELVETAGLLTPADETETTT